MNDPKHLRRIQLTLANRPTGNTRHFGGGEFLPVPAELRIVQYENDAGFYLFYCDKTGLKITDTYHDSIEQAMTQASFEFTIHEDEWEVFDTPAQMVRHKR
ncbi:hypothetical protein AB1L42_12630 [Thalassoglobus sp. JC818]|uniref:hypothetical protein n=1 Tax=Thalassoglobus sp. JC818 TaxID=3232136 RepID=UPI003457C8C7